MMLGGISCPVGLRGQLPWDSRGMLVVLACGRRLAASGWWMGGKVSCSVVIADGSINLFK